MFSKSNKSNPSLLNHDNTPLIDAILSNHTEATLKLIEADKLSNNSIINQSSQGNTPLLLALKTGNIEVAHALLKHPGIDVEVRDCFGMSPLHWACYLRLDDVIENILARQPSTSLNPDSSYLSSHPDDRSEIYANEFKYLTPEDFYSIELMPVETLWIPQKLYDKGGVIIGNKGPKVSSVHNIEMYLHKETPRAALYIRNIMLNLAQIPLTILAFHMDTLCINYCQFKEDQFIRSCYTSHELDDRSHLYKPRPFRQASSSNDPNDKIYANDQEIWKANFNTGYMSFRALRNNKPLNAAIVSQLKALSVSNSADDAPGMDL